MKTKILITLTAAIIGVAIVAAIAPALNAVAYWLLPIIAGVAFGLFVAIATISWLAWGSQWLADRRVARGRVEAETRLIDARARRETAETITAPPGSQIVVVDYLNDVAKNVHLSPTIHVNGLVSQAEPTPAQERRWFAHAALCAPRAGAERGGAVPLIESGPARPGLIEIMAKLDRILLVGGTGAGKTNALKHYVAYLVATGQVVSVVDPHSPSKLLGIDVIGAKTNFEQIADFFMLTMATVSARYQAGQIAQDGNLGDLNQFLIVEEFLDIHEQLGDLATAFLKVMLIRARKAGFRFCLVSQNDSVDALGIKGNAGLLKGAERVELRRDLATDHRAAVVGWQKSNQFECDAPPLFVDYPSVPPSQLVIEEPPRFSPTERALIRAIIDNPQATKADLYRLAGISKNSRNSQFIDQFKAKFEGV